MGIKKIHMPFPMIRNGGLDWILFMKYGCRVIVFRLYFIELYLFLFGMDTIKLHLDCTSLKGYNYQY
jgi:hypothetical protein